MGDLNQQVQLSGDAGTMVAPPFDSRFPNQNQSRSCWQNYVDYYRCQKIKGEDYKPCDFFKRVYSLSCPNEWTEEWDGQREKGAFGPKI